MVAVRVDIEVVMMDNDVVDIIVDFCRIWLNFLDWGGVTLIIYVYSRRLPLTGPEWKRCAFVCFLAYCAYLHWQHPLDSSGERCGV